MAKFHRIEPAQTARARQLRRDAPFPERLLWSRLRAGRLQGIRFRRQHAVGRYIADFYCAQANLVIELDGRSHESRESYDAERTGFIASQGLRVIRFSDDEVVRSIDEVVHRIACEIALDRKPENPLPASPWKGEE